MSHLYLALLGPVDVTLDGGTSLSFRYAKLRALLVYLVVECQRAHTRDALAELLWPEQAPGVARSSLRQALAELREVIHDRSETPPFLLITRETLQFNPASAHSSDIAKFTTLVTPCTHQARLSDEACAACAERWDAATALYRGPFLDQAVPRASAGFEEWALLRREQLEQQMLDVLARLADHYERRGAQREALVYARRQLQLDRWREATHRQVMRLLAAEGERSAALAQYQACCRVLQSELGVEPESETTALYTCILGSVTGPTVVHPAGVAAPSYVLPGQPTSFVGREAELKELTALLQQADCRLVTVLGPGGIGKTRLALKLAETYGVRFNDGVCWVALAGVAGREDLIEALARALHVPLVGEGDLLQRLLDTLRSQSLLLVLDNFEQLVSEAALVARMLTESPRLKIVATSRERLQLQWEWLFDVEGLSYPSTLPVDDITRYGAVQLFMERAQRVRRNRPAGADEAGAIVRICQLVDGMPLALELAAASSREQEYATIAAAIVSDLDVLQLPLRDQPARHHSVRAAFEHSWRCLDVEQQGALARLAVFRGGFDGDAARAVAEATAELLSTLVDKSLVRRNDGARYGMLDLIRHFAYEKLQEMEAATEVRHTHLRHFVALAEEAEPELQRADQEVWLQRLEREHDNLRAALQAGLADDEVELAARLAGAIWRFWWVRGYISEGRRWFDQLLGRSLSAAVQAKALSAASSLAFYQNDLERARAYADASVAFNRLSGNRAELARTLDNVGVVMNRQGEYSQARAVFEEAVLIDRQLGDIHGLAFALGNLADTCYFEGDYPKAGRLYEQSLAMHREFGDQHSIAISLANMAEMARLQGDYDHARSYVEASIALLRELGAPYILAVSLSNLGHIRRLQGAATDAAARYSEALPLLFELGDLRVAAETVAGLAALALQAQAMPSAITLLAATAVLLESSGAAMEPANQTDYQQTVEQARAQTDETTWLSTWTVARTMSLEETKANIVRIIRSSLTVAV